MESGGLSPKKTPATGIAKVTVMGQDYTLSGDVEPSYVTDLAEYVDTRMRELQQKAPGMSAAKIAVLVALNISDELFTLRRSLEDAEKAGSRQIQTLTAELAKRLGNSVDREPLEIEKSE
jgi:cell division protein ZapA